MRFWKRLLCRREFSVSLSLSLSLSVSRPPSHPHSPPCQRADSWLVFPRAHVHEDDAAAAAARGAPRASGIVAAFRSFPRLCRGRGRERHELISVSRVKRDRGRRSNQPSDGPSIARFRYAWPGALSIRALVETRESPLERTLSASSASRRISHRDVGPRRPVAVLMTTQFANFANAGASCRSRSTFDPRTLRSAAPTSGEPVSSRAIRATPRMNFSAAPRLNSPPRGCRSSGRWSGISRDHEKSNF